jgi:hypothetical protein
MIEKQKRLQDALILRIQRVCEHVVRGKHAIRDSSVWKQKTLAISSIVLSTMSGTGIIAFRQSEISFWISVGLLLLSILTQIGDEFGLKKRAAAAIALSAKCNVYENQFEGIFYQESVDPQIAVSDLLTKLENLISDTDNSPVLTPRSDEIIRTSADWANTLVTRHQPLWDLQVVKSPFRRPSDSLRGGGAE